MLENEPLLTVRDIARMLSISTGAVRKRASRGSIPGAVFVGGGLYFNPAIIRMWTDPRDTGVRNRAREMSTITIRPWPGTTNDKEWEVDIRYPHPTLVDARGKAKRLRKRCQHVGTRASVEKWAHAYVSAEMTRLASGAVAGLTEGLKEGQAPAYQPSTARGAIPTFAEFFPRHLEYMRANGLKERTIQSYETLFRLYLGPLLGHFRLDRIGAAEIEGIKGALVKPRPARQRVNPRTGEQSNDPQTAGKALQPSTINQILHKVAAILQVAKYLGIIASPPSVRYMKEPKKDPECYTFADACAFVEAAEDHLTRASSKRASAEALHDLAIVLLLLDTGIRVGELIAIHPDQIDLDNKVLHVKLTESAGMLTIPKGGRARDVPLTSRLVTVLRSLLAQTPGPRLLMRTHKWEREIEPYNQQAIWASLNRTLERAGYVAEEGMGRAGRGPHRWRHTAATLMLESGVDLATVQKILGHARIEQTSKYLHLSGESMQRGSALYEARFTRGRHGGDERPNPPPPLH